MALSRKNLDQLKFFLNKKNKINNNFEDNNSVSDSNSLTKHDPKEVNNPDQIFYSIIDNAEHLEDTIVGNNKLKNIEENLIKKKHNDRLDNQIYSQRNKKLSEEDLLYDEFNYLLDE